MSIEFERLPPFELKYFRRELMRLCVSHVKLEPTRLPVYAYGASIDIFVTCTFEEI